MKVKRKPLQVLSNRINLKQALLATAASTALLGILAWIIFTYLNVAPVTSVTAAEPTKTAQTGNWHAPGTWSPVGVPGDDDVILIPAGVTVTVRGTDHTMNKAILIIEGRLSMETTCGLCLDYGSLTFTGSPSGVIIEDGGRVTDDTWFGGDTHFISVQGVTFWSGDDCSSNCGSTTSDFTAAATTAWPGTLLNPLPVEIGTFEAAYRNGTVELMWTTLMEKNNSHFEIERSFDGSDFETIGQVEGNGNSSTKLDYAFVDDDPMLVTHENIYYRLRQVDYDEKYEHSKIVAAYNDHVQEPVETPAADLIVNVYPNPMTGNQLKIRLQEPTAGNVFIVNSRGQRVFSGSLTDETAEHALSVDGDFDPGVYVVNFESVRGRGSTKLVKR